MAEEPAKRFVGGFWDWVSNPWARFRSETDEDELRRQLMPKGETATEDEIARLVELLRHKRNRYVARDLLGDIGAAAVPHLVKSLNNPVFWKTDASDWCHCPYGMVIGLLEPFMPAECADVVLAKTEDADEAVEEAAIAYVARLGSDECIVPLQRALHKSLQGDREDQEHLLRATCFGLLDCLRAGRGTTSLRQAMFDAVLPLLDDSYFVGQAAEIMLSTDQARARSMLLSEKYFNLDYPYMHEVLGVFTNMKLPVPLDTVREFAESLRTNYKEYPRDYQFSACLESLVGSKHPDAEELVEEALHSDESSVCRDACRFLLLLRDVPDPGGVAYARLDRERFANLPRVVQDYVAVDILFAEVGNGGFSQYFANPNADSVSNAVRAFRGWAPDAAIIVERAFDVFGEGGPSSDLDTRLYQLSRLSDDDLDKLNALDLEFYEHADSVVVSLTKVVVDNREHFVEPPDQVPFTE